MQTIGAIKAITLYRNRAAVEAMLAAWNADEPAATDIRYEVGETARPDGPRYFIRVLDAETGEQIGTL